ncbi:MAG TPA: class III extradiol ring-cleavage dioxygenase [Methylophilaceae bacterium]|nr:class III extradiol ring-cleavage dioxygenase [Methylophilaceae bacterium]
MSKTRFPVFFISHGGGPWSYIDGLREQYAVTEAALKNLPQTLPEKPKAILVISGHWEAPVFTVSTSEHPPTIYDYSGFPEHTYHIRYPAPGSPQLAARVQALMSEAGIANAADPQRGFDHGTFVPLGLMYPDADVPVVLMSLKNNYDPVEHIRAGQALRPLRDEGVLIIGSGLNYHNMRGFGRADAIDVSVQFEHYLYEAVTSAPEKRLQMLADWQQAPSARLAHPREDHLMPLMVAAGAAGESAGERLMLDEVMGVVMVSYRWSRMGVVH